ncbi:Co2+/Mg2+ efflux protein ApaG [Congregibacter brevis]|uniref:Protein ApaG n=1 Tax=Congregibacter brevis TaxID=3081201 RepID=A0ABZ0IBP8_9GAMM|nr:Co2+/Mg2+ efflux protein ApaG [Congregibacter sp. IMCC45268]
MSQIKTLNPALIGIATQTTYLPTHSRPEDDQYTFAYTITISNAGDVSVQLLSRFWQITDADGDVQEVRGEGVVGEQPIIRPGRYFRYTSGATLPTPVGYMNGEYTMILHDDDRPPDPRDQLAFEVSIPAFTLHTPTSLN